MSTHIIVKTQFTGNHRYPDAPEEVKFLRDTHRHIFFVEVQIEVFHDDRELEFIMVKRALNVMVQEFVADYRGTFSCEMVARDIQKWARENYPVPESAHPRTVRRVEVKVFEDNENGAYIKED